MSSRTGSVAGGLTLAAAGALLLALGLLRSPLLPPGLGGGITGPAAATVVGFVLAMAGAILSIFTFRHVPEQAPVTPAHVAFMTRTPRPIDAPERVHMPPRIAPRPRSSKEQATMTRIDDEIRDLTRKINKAGVMLATGQISHQGYAQYVDDLKKQRGALEANRVRIELHRD